MAGLQSRGDKPLAVGLADRRAMRGASCVNGGHGTALTDAAIHPPNRPTPHLAGPRGAGDPNHQRGRFDSVPPAPVFWPDVETDAELRDEGLDRLVIENARLRRHITQLEAQLVHLQWIIDQRRPIGEVA